MTGMASWTSMLAAVFLLPVSAGLSAEGTDAEAQLSAILRDRPRMAVSLRKRPQVRAWILERFRETDPPLLWDPAPPVSGRAAEWDARDPGLTLVRVSGEPSGIDQLVNLLFELHNIEGYGVFESIHDEAVRGEITREGYASRMLEQEFHALLAARMFYREHLSDLSRIEEREARSYYRMIHGTDSFEEHVAEELERGFDLLDHFRMLYDTIVLPEREQKVKAVD